MKTMNFWLLCCALCVVTSRGSGGPVQETLDIIRLIREVTNSILKSWDLIEKIPASEVAAGAVIYANQLQILSKLEEFTGNIRNLEEQQARNTVLIIETLLREWQGKEQVLHRLNQWKDVTKFIDFRYNQLNDYERNKDSLESITLINFAKWTVDPGSTSLAWLLHAHHDYLYATGPELDYKHSLLSMLTTNFDKSPEQICLARQSAQQFAYQLFYKATFTQLKGYSLMEISWMLLRQAGRGNFTEEMRLMRRNHQNRMQNAQQVLQLVISDSSRLYWRCDPGKNKHVEGQTYGRVTRLLQGFVENEVNLNTEQSCMNSCGDYHDTRSSGCYKPEEEFCGQQPACKGRLYNCNTIESDISVCPSSNASSARRYEYISFKDDGNSPDCESQVRKPSSWSSWIFWRCHYCFCLCDEPSTNSDRYFNLRDSLSDFKQNKVVTGVRFVKSQRVFHLQLQ
ncbi:uncharacterized protein LOC6615691 [Drosophila sechellia]|uniref:uncharacterized protein LOC6615691 n=1 Tax=Drosophila sechellia TaxID=7238 RepID=UPI0013DDE0DF|nr:uncharacterized protein LOC6615691 [Drosophila sechellia]